MTNFTQCFIILYDVQFCNYVDEVRSID